MIQELVLKYVDQYGYIILFLSLLLELLGLPLPGEALMGYTGLLVYQGKLNWLLSVGVAFTGISIGITCSYFIGLKLGPPFFQRYGHLVHMTPERVLRLEEWFAKYGNKVIVVAYFVPGVRHVTGYFAGITQSDFQSFGRHAYLGALIWAGVFISLGKVLGPEWLRYQAAAERYLIVAGILMVVGSLIFFTYKKNKLRYQKELSSLLTVMVDRYGYSSDRVRGMISLLMIISGGLLALMIGLIQDLSAQEFGQFDLIASYLVRNTLGASAGFLQWVGLLTTMPVVGPFLLLTGIFIFFRSQEKRLDLAFFFLTVVGGEMLEELLRIVFHRLGPVSGVYTFPSEQSLTAVTIYGFSAFLLFRYTANRAMRWVIPTALVGLLLLIGANRIYFKIQFPSDVAAGFVFGGVWLLFNMVILETNRLLKQADHSAE